MKKKLLMTLIALGVFFIASCDNLQNLMSDPPNSLEFKAAELTADDAVQGAEAGEFSAKGGSGDLVYSLIDDDNGRFEVKGNLLTIKAQNLGEGDFSVTARVEDQEGRFLEKDFELTVAPSSKSSEPENPDTPETPNESGDPEDPDGPEIPNIPEIPGEPENPDDPDEPTAPEVPVGPEQPVGPGQPEDPNEPNAPEVPVGPEQPVGPGQPEDPDEPNAPEVPVGPEQPAGPGQPEDPDEPNVPEVPDTPGTPSQPGTPGAPSAPAKPPRVTGLKSSPGIRHVNLGPPRPGPQATKCTTARAATSPPRPSLPWSPPSRRQR
ncbi:MAG: hypothetical protein LBU16_00010 [Treponema sp.]|nr:hypothetical protein [Treponema sp.]